MLVITLCLAGIKGKGAYYVGGKNVTAGSSGVPQFGTTRTTSIRIKYREYMTDVINQTANTFQQTQYALNPGLNLAAGGCFNWLANIASQFEEYKWHGLLFEFKSTSANAMSTTATALGETIMATQYNPLNPPFANSGQMLQYEYAVSQKTSRDSYHGVEVRRKDNQVDMFYTRTGPLPASGNLQLSDIGTFYFAINGFPASANNIGQQWVCYDIQLYKPKLLGNGSEAQSDHFILP